MPLPSMVISAGPVSSVSDGPPIAAGYRATRLCPGISAAAFRALAQAASFGVLVPLAKPQSRQLERHAPQRGLEAADVAYSITLYVL